MQPGTAIYFLMDEHDVQRILAFDDTMIGSDGIPVGEKPHPRLWGTFPRVLGHYSREVGLFPLETAVWKMTGLTARNFGLADRGTVAVGQHADLVLFDAGTVKDAATYDEPTRPAEGIHAVIVNGGVAWEGGRSTGVRRGRVLRTRPRPTRHGAPRSGAGGMSAAAAIRRYPTPLPVPFSKAVRAGDFLFLSGVLAMDAQAHIVEGDVQVQTKRGARAHRRHARGMRRDDGAGGEGDDLARRPRRLRRLQRRVREALRRRAAGALLRAGGALQGREGGDRGPGLRARRRHD